MMITKRVTVRSPAWLRTTPIKPSDCSKFKLCSLKAVRQQQGWIMQPESPPAAATLTYSPEGCGLFCSLRGCSAAIRADMHLHPLASSMST